MRKGTNEKAISLTIKLTNADFDSNFHRWYWNFPLLQIPEPELEIEKYIGRLGPHRPALEVLPKSWFKPDPKNERIVWNGYNQQPVEELTIECKLIRDLSKLEETKSWKIKAERWKLRATVMTALAAILTALTGLISLFPIDSVFGDISKEQKGNFNSTEPIAPLVDSLIFPFLGSLESLEFLLLTQSEAVTLVKEWLEAKKKIFAPPFDINRLEELVHTEGDLYKAITSPNKGIDWLQSNKSFYEYTTSSVQNEFSFLTSAKQPELKVKIYEDKILNTSNGIDRNNSGAETSVITYKFMKQGENWKIYDYVSE